MAISRLLIANRGEIAIRIAQAAADLGITSVAVYAEDDAASLHTWRADEARPLAGSGALAYLDIEGLVRVAKEAGCDAVHPGYGFLSENAEFARAGGRLPATLVVGPTPDALDLFGHKAEARVAGGARAGVPADCPRRQVTRSTLDERRGLHRVAGAERRGHDRRPSPAAAAAAFAPCRGARRVPETSASTRCQSEAKAAFGNDEAAAARSASSRGPAASRVQGRRRRRAAA
ncbi:MAG: biotin carboxylase N-terminal domain-containing protein [Dehalococcoidia bacterium]|nr:biotin carboxylase N-terminal domain-containing protein [Dehalococcoidia bacterium]